MQFFQNAALNPPLPKGKTIAHLWSLFFYYLLALLIAAILTPLAFNLVLYWDQHAPCHLTRYLIRKNFTTFFERIRLISFFLFAPCLLKIYRQLEENRPNHSGKCKAYWQFFGIGILLIAMIFGLKSLVFDFSFTPLKIPLLVKFLLAAAFLSFLEEWLFRGLIFGAMVNAMKPFQAIIFSSLIFAYFHFSPRYSIPAHHTFLNLSDGFRCFYENIFPGLNHIAYLKFLIIFSLGCLLATVYFHSKNLFTAIGLHGGIVFALMICKTCFSFPVTNSFFGSNHLFDSPLAILLIATVGIGIHSYHGHFHPTK